MEMFDEIIGELKVYDNIVEENGKMAVKTVPFRPKRIYDVLIKECEMNEKDALKITSDVISMIIQINVPFFTAPLIREFVSISLMCNNFIFERYLNTRLGIPYWDYDNRYKNNEELEKWSSEKIHDEYVGINKIKKFINIK